MNEVFQHFRELDLERGSIDEALQTDQVIVCLGADELAKVDPTSLPDDGVWHYARGLICEASGDVAGALQAFQVAYGRMENDWRVMFHLAKAANATRQAPQMCLAEQLHRKILELRPDFEPWRRILEESTPHFAFHGDAALAQARNTPNGSHRTAAQTGDAFVKSILSHPPSVNERNMVAQVARVNGWFTHQEIFALYRATRSLPEGARILEFGSYCGRSTNAIGHAIRNTRKEVFCIDSWRAFGEQKKSAQPAPNDKPPPTALDILTAFLRNTEWFSEQVRILRGRTADFKALLPHEFFDLAFIDADHKYAGVCEDIRIAFPTLKPGGILCGHDFHDQGGEEVQQAVKELVFSDPSFEEHGVFPNTSIWYARKGTGIRTNSWWGSKQEARSTRRSSVPSTHQFLIEGEGILDGAVRAE
jgi:predicted O-methyltransferase YrrM